jgi:hypothetical protein
MSKTCGKCKKIFTSVYLANKHLNRKIPCDPEEEARKIASIKEKKITKQIQQKIDKEKIIIKKEEREKKQQFEQEKINIKREEREKKQQFEQEKINIKREETEKKQKNLMASYKARENLYLIKSEMMENDNMHKNLRKISSVRTEQENRDKIAELRNIERTYNIKKSLKLISDKIPVVKRVFTAEDVSKSYDEIHYKNTEYFINNFHKHSTIEEIILDALKNTLNNDEHPECRNIYYSRKENVFLAFVYDNDSNEKIIITMNYDQVYQVLAPVIKTCFNIYTGKTGHMERYYWDSKPNKEITSKFAEMELEFNVFKKYNASIENTKLIENGNDLVVVCNKPQETQIIYKQNNDTTFLDKMHNGIHVIVSNCDK